MWLQIIRFALVSSCLWMAGVSSAQCGEFKPGETWLDTAGERIQAHGGGLLHRSNTWFWYGEDRTPGGKGAVAVYSSTNLYDWKPMGVALSKADLPVVDGKRTFVERPKVIYNQRTGKYVMWTHLEQPRYAFARAGIAISDTPVGPFTFVKAIRPITNDFNFPDDDRRQKQLGGTYRDMNLFVDDDGSAYAFYASEDNWTMYIVRLNREFTGPQEPAIQGKTWARVFVRQMREAPAPFKHAGKYYVITSGCTGWKPNPAGYAVAENILGPYESKGNPCVGPESELTFRSQSTSVFPVPGRPGQFVLMADRWKPDDLSDSRYIWLPFKIREDGTFTIAWRDRWNLEDL